MAVVVAVAALAISFPTGVRALPSSTLKGSHRSILAADTSCEAPAVAPGNGCVFLTNCTMCTDSKCVANYEMKALEQQGAANDLNREQEAALCEMIASVLTPDGNFGPMPYCPNDTIIDAAADNVWTNMGTMTGAISDWETSLSTPELTKTFLAEKCTTNTLRGMCTSKSQDTLITVTASPSCVNAYAEHPPAMCRTDPLMVNETCSLATGMAAGLEETVLKAVRNTALELHSECQKLTTEAECHAFDGSAMVKMLNETSTAADVQAILASAQAQTTGFGLVILVALMSILMF